jgi:hypothetical protein
VANDHCSAGFVGGRPQADPLPKIRRGRHPSAHYSKEIIMTDPNYTALLFVIDRSGSMDRIRDDMVGGLQQLLAEQAVEPGLLTVDIVTFDDVVERTHHFANPGEVAIELVPRATTALLDAIGISVHQFGHELSLLPEHARPETVQVVVVTDGLENSSQEYTVDDVRELVETQKETYSWEFVFLGADQDAVLTGKTLGFDAGASMTYAAGPEGVAEMSRSVSRFTSSIRAKQKRNFDAEERRRAQGGNTSA